jgi:dipeptidyl-peptidase-3
MHDDNPAPAATAAPPDRQYLLERVGEAAVVQLYADGFRALSLREKTLVWHLYRAAIAGRDIFYDQRHRYHLEMRDLLEAIVVHRSSCDPATFEEIEHYTKLFWMNTGAYNNLTARKFVLTCGPERFAAAAHAAVRAGAVVPLRDGESLDDLLERLRPMFFDPEFEPTVTAKSPPPGQDILTASANNLHVGVTMADLEGSEERYPLNSRLVKQNGRLIEEVYRIDGRYGSQIAAIVRHLEAAADCAPEATARALRALVAFYRSGEDADREAYDVAWVQDKEAPVDTINGFVEVYLDARSIKGAWEALVFYVNREKTTQNPDDCRSRAVVRRSHAVGSEIPQAGRPRRHRQRHRHRHRNR